MGITENAASILNRTAMKNRSLFELEHKLAMPTTGKTPVISPQSSSSQESGNEVTVYE